LIIATMLCGLAGFSIAQWLITPQYESSGILIVNTAESSNTSITYDQISVAQQLVDTYSIILKSDTVLDLVIQNLGLSIDAKTLGKSITIEGINSTEVIGITVRNPDPQIAADIANEMIEVAPTYILKTINAGSVEIISPAKKSDVPVVPNKPLITAGGLLVGLIMAVSISLAMEMLNSTFNSGEDVQNFLGYPVIGVIPNIKKKSTK
jgi:capsular polysaccharide biosynthesis protein